MDIDEALIAVKRFELQFDMAAKRPGAADDIRRTQVHLRAKAAQVREFLTEHKSMFSPLSGELGDLTDLPAELLEELTVAQPDELEAQILSVVTALGRTADLDQMLVGLYRKFKVVQKRRVLQNKVWRLTKKGAIHAVPGRRGVYSLDKPPEPEGPLNGRFQRAEMEDEIPF